MPVSSSRPRMSRFSLRLVLVNLVLIAIPVALYYFFYVEAQREQITVRNMRALSATADRLVTLIQNFDRVGQYAAIPKLGGFYDLLKSDTNLGSKGSCLPQVELAAETLRDVQETYVNELSSIQSAPRFELIPAIVDRGAKPAAANADLPAGQRRCARNWARALETLIRQDSSYVCADKSRTLRRVGNDVFLDIDVCDSIERRRVFDYLEDYDYGPAFGDGAAVRAIGAEAFQSLGLRIRLDMESLGDLLTAPIGEDFDQVLIVDGAGRPAYNSADHAASLVDRLGQPMPPRLERFDFARFRSLADILEISSQKQRDSDVGSELPIARVGSLSGDHSRVTRVDVAGVPYQFFIQPIRVGKVGRDSVCSPDSSGSCDDTWHIVGVIKESAFTEEALRLNVPTLLRGILVVGILIALLPIIWIWTSGNRQLLLRRHFFMLLVSGGIAALLATLQLSFVREQAQMNGALDDVLVRFGDRVKEEFHDEFKSRFALVSEHSCLMYAESSEEDSDMQTRVRADLDPCLSEILDDSSATDTSVYANGDQPTHFTRYPPFDLAITMGDNGWQYGDSQTFRRLDLPRLYLGFRDYYKRAARDELWKLASGPPFFLERVTSIIDNTIESVMSVRVDDIHPEYSGKAQVTALVGRFDSLENVVLPPFMGFVVLDNTTGEVLYHEPTRDALTANFMSDTDFSEVLAATLASPNVSALMRLNYRASDIVAYAQPLAEGTPLSLIAYRSVELEETVGLMALTYTLGIAFGALLFALVLFVSLRAVCHAFGTLWPYRFGAYRQLVLAVGLLAAVVIVALPLSALLSPMVGLAWLLLVSSTVLLVSRILGSREQSLAKLREDRKPVWIYPLRSGSRLRMTSKALIVVLLLCFFVGPAWLLSTHFHTQLQLAAHPVVAQVAAHHVENRCVVLDGLARRYKKELTKELTGRVRGFIGPRYGNYVEGRRGERVNETLCHRYPGLLQNRFPSSVLEAGSGLFYGLFEPVTRYSLLSATLHGFLNRGSYDGTGIDLLDSLVKSSGAPGPEPESSSQGSLVWAFPLIVLIGVVVLTAVTLSRRVLAAGALVRIEPLGGDRAKARDRALRHYAVIDHSVDRVAALKERADADRTFVIIDRSNLDRLLDDCSPDAPEQVTGGAGQEATVANSEEDSQPSAAGLSYAVMAFDDLVTDRPTRRKLLKFLQQGHAQGAELLLSSRVNPNYFFTLAANYGDPYSEPDLAERRQWKNLLAEFSMTYEEADNSELLDGIDEESLDCSVLELAKNEAIAFPRLGPTVRSLLKYLVNEKVPVEQQKERFLAQIIMRGEPQYQKAWTRSSLEERLQLLALARGGFVNALALRAVTSLHHRNLVEIELLARIRSLGFSRYVRDHVSHEALTAWRHQDTRNVWTEIGVPLAVIAGLAMAFLFVSSPGAVASLSAVLTAGIGIAPLVLSLMSGLRGATSGSASAED